MWGLVYSDCKHAVQEGTHGVGAPHDSASFNKGNIQNTEVRGLVDTCRNWAVQEGKYGVDTPHESASLNKGNIQNTQVREDSVAVACVVPDAGDTAFQIHCLRRSAYAAVLGAFCAQSDLFSRAKQECLAELRNELKISDTEHREYIVKASTNKHIMSLSLSAWLYKGNNGDAAVVTEFLDLKCVIPDAGGAAFQIHCLERSAYAYVLRAFCAQPNLLPWARLLTKLRNELRLSYIEHQEVIATVSSNAYIKSLRKFSLANYSGLTKKTPAFDLRAVVPDKESSKHRPLNSKTSPCAMKAVCAVSPMFQGKHGQSNAGPVPWCVHKAACHVHPAEHDEVTPPPKPGSSSSYDETPTSSITELRRAEAERDVVETRRELEPAAKRTWRPTVRALGSEWVERLSRKRKKRRREECVQ
ncbi:hypothetical protein ACQ4PT_060903 [Festuca glaucescens]